MKTHEAAEVCRDWWENILPKYPGDKSRLKRAANCHIALTVPATHSLLKRLPTKQPQRELRIAGLAALLAQVDECPDKAQPMPKALAASKGERLLYSPTRFRRLLQADDADSLLQQLRRALRILDNQVHVPSLYEAMMFWSFERDGSSKQQVRWACSYYANIPTP
jgi:CRISPR type I-E-associated protein CasB/Cse2